MDRSEVELVAVAVRPQHRAVCDDSSRSATHEPRMRACLTAIEPARRGDELHALDQTPLVVGGRAD